MVVEQGTNFTFMHSRGPMEVDDIGSYRARNELLSASRVWLGATGGTDWLHDAIEREFGEDTVWYDVESARHATHVGAAGEVATVALILMGAGALDMVRKFYSGFAERMGEAAADSVLEWVREQTAERRRRAGLEQADGPPNFFDWELNGLAQGMRSEVSDVVGVPESRLEVKRAIRDETYALIAIYQDVSTDRRFEVLVKQDSATFRPVQDE